MRSGHHLPGRRRGLDRRRAPHRHRGDRDPVDGGDPGGPARARGRGYGRRDRPDRGRRDPQRRRRGEVPGARRERGGDRPLGADGAELQQGDPRRHRLRGHGGGSGWTVLPLPHRSLPGRGHHPGPRAAQAPARRRGGPARLQLPAHDDARMPDAGPGVREDQRAQPGARGPGRAYRRGLGHGPGAAGRHRLHPGCVRGADAGPDRAVARAPRGEPDRLPGTGARGGGVMSETEYTVSIDAEYLAGRRFPYQEDIALVEDVDLLAATPGPDLNWLEDVELLKEDAVPAVFDRYSNSFLKIYFRIPEGREDEIARKVLIKHLQSGNSYGIHLKD